MKERLLDTGFKNWTKNDYLNFISGCEKYGRTNYDKISKKVGK